MQTIKILLIAFISSFITLVGSKYFQEKDGLTIIHQNETPKIIPTTNKNNNFLNPNTNFIEAAEKTVNAVVHVKNTTTENKTRSGYYFLEAMIQESGLVQEVVLLFLQTDTL